MQIQTRSDNGELLYFDTLRDALLAAQKDSEIWKISFALPTGERVRLVYSPSGWVFENIDGNRYLTLENANDK